MSATWNASTIRNMVVCEATIAAAEDMTVSYVEYLTEQAPLVAPLLRKGRPVVGSDHEAIAQHVLEEFIAWGRTGSAAVTARTRLFGLIKYVAAFPQGKTEPPAKYSARVMAARAVVNSGQPKEVAALMEGKAASSKRPGAAAAAAKRAAAAADKTAAAAAANESVVNRTNNDPTVTTTIVEPAATTPRAVTLDDLKTAVAEFVEASRKVDEILSALRAAGVKVPKTITSLAESAATTTAKAMTA